MKLTNPLVIQCEECQEIIEVNVDLECISSEEHSMGTECEYEGIIEDVCPVCKNEININLSVWEYPVGAINYQNEEITGAKILEGPNYEPFDSDDFDI